MQALTKGFIAGAVGLAVLVPAGIAIADDEDDAPPRYAVCTDDERQDHWQVHDRLQAEILGHLHDEGVTDPERLREELRDRLHDAIEDEYGELPCLGAGQGPAVADDPDEGGVTGETGDGDDTGEIDDDRPGERDAHRSEGRNVGHREDDRPMGGPGR